MKDLNLLHPKIECSHPNVFVFRGEIPEEKQKIIDDWGGENKKILMCGHCDTIWANYYKNDWEEKYPIQKLIKL